MKPIQNNTDYNNICIREKVIVDMLSTIERKDRLLYDPSDDRFLSLISHAEKVLEQIYELKLNYGKNRLNQNGR